eukprot:jgi/Picsp_1/2594/NSC_00825-R1_plant glycogenin-like starch initiation protein 6
MEDAAEMSHGGRRMASNGAPLLVVVPSSPSSSSSLYGKCQQHGRCGRLAAGVVVLILGIVGVVAVLGKYGESAACLAEWSCGPVGGRDGGRRSDSDDKNGIKVQLGEEKKGDPVHSLLTSGNEKAGAKGGKQGYVSLLYGDEFGLAMRVLGQSLKESKTTRDMVALVTRQVSREMQDTLRLDGWEVRRVEEVENPGQWEQGNAAGRFPRRFWAVYTKLLVFSLDEYERLVYLDADTIVNRNID